MTTLTQSELDDMRRYVKEQHPSFMYDRRRVIALLDHIAHLTAERDEARKEFAAAQVQADSNYKRWCDAHARIAALEAQPSAQFVAGMRRAAEIVMKQVREAIEVLESQIVAHNTPIPRTDYREFIEACRTAQYASQALACASNHAILAEAALKGEGE